ncbi:hypothetical protein CFOL_v3_02005 [Cephalotus follicularis]|uniref:Uncharacterized protein n=1 Tax=Cephalotus follicularis TaxID=3775 RepID=A0A1Q3ARX2_CEPFO|nr:hypothetical protein CFOL_v3_02005 [Cephalotus follicularis]
MADVHVPEASSPSIAQEGIPNQSTNASEILEALRNDQTSITELPIAPTIAFASVPCLEWYRSDEPDVEKTYLPTMLEAIPSTPMQGISFPSPEANTPLESTSLAPPLVKKCPSPSLKASTPVDLLISKSKDLMELISKTFNTPYIAPLASSSFDTLKTLLSRLALSIF